MLEDIFCNKSQTKVVDYALSNLDTWFTAPDIHQGAGIDRNTIYKILPKLLELGIIKRAKPLGNAKTYEVDKNWPILKKLIEFDFALSSFLTHKEAGDLALVKEKIEEPLFVIEPERETVEIEQMKYVRVRYTQPSGPPPQTEEEVIHLKDISEEQKKKLVKIEVR